jgi:hypothetical protein
MFEMIHVDFEITRRDLFTVNLNLIRWRLVAGLSIALSLILALGYFFWLIGETAMFLQLSALFIGFPLLAVGGQVLRLRAECGRLIKSMPEQQRKIQMQFQQDVDGFDVHSGASFAHVAWQDVAQVKETNDHFLIKLDRYQQQVIPKRGFHQLSDVEAFRKLTRSQLGLRTKLRS